MHIYIYTHTGIVAGLDTNAAAFGHIYIYIYRNIFTCMYIHSYIHMHIYVYTGRVAGRDTKAIAVGYKHINIYKTDLNICTYVTVYICIYIYDIYICIYIYTQEELQDLI